MFITFTYGSLLLIPAMETVFLVASVKHINMKEHVINLSVF